MPRGKGRRPAPPGYMTPSEAGQILGTNRIYNLVKNGKLKRYTLKGYSHGYYKKEEVEAIQHIEDTFFKSGLATDLLPAYVRGQWRNNPTSTFEIATEQDIPAIVEISNAIFGSSQTPNEVRFAWMRKNPEIYFVLRDHEEQRIVGFTLILPLSREVINRFIHDEIAMQDIPTDDVDCYEPGKPLHLYMMATGIDPQYGQRKKHEYGARMVHGLFGFFFGLAKRAVQVETITARSHKPDGIRLLRKLGIPQLHSPASGVCLFRVVVADSGFVLFERYCEILSQTTGTALIHRDGTSRGI